MCFSHDYLWFNKPDHDCASISRPGCFFHMWRVDIRPLNPSVPILTWSGLYPGWRLVFIIKCSPSSVILNCNQVLNWVQNKVWAPTLVRRKWKVWAHPFHQLVCVCTCVHMRMCRARDGRRTLLSPVAVPLHLAALMPTWIVPVVFKKVITIDVNAIDEYIIFILMRISFL